MPVEVAAMSVLTRRWCGARAALVVVVVFVVAGCSSLPIPPTYTQDELKAICERHGGWWHPDDLMGGYCEYDSQM